MNLCLSNCFRKKKVKKLCYLLKLFLTLGLCSFNHILLPTLDLMCLGLMVPPRTVVRRTQREGILRSSIIRNKSNRPGRRNAPAYVELVTVVKCVRQDQQSIFLATSPGARLPLPHLEWSQDWSVESKVGLGKSKWQRASWLIFSATQVIEK